MRFCCHPKLAAFKSGWWDQWAWGQLLQIILLLHGGVGGLGMAREGVSMAGRGH